MLRQYFALFLGMALALTSFAAELVVYTALEDDEVAVYRKDFEAKHPDIELKIVRDSTGIMTAKLMAEKDNPQADVVWGLAATSLLICDRAGMLKGYEPSGLDELKEGFYDQRNFPPHWVGIKAWMTGIVVNTIETAKQDLPAPSSFEDLTRPELKDKIVMPNPASSGTGYLTVSAILQLMGEEEGWAYLDRLHENIAMYTHSGSKPAKLAGTGEFPIGISFGYRGVKQALEGEPVITVFPREGSGWDLEANALIRKPRTKKAAETFLDWAISEDVMRMYAEVYPITARPTDVEPIQGYPDDPAEQLIENDFEWAAENRERILREWSRRYEGKQES